MLFHSDIKAHVYKSAKEKKNRYFNQETDKLVYIRTTKNTLTQMSLLVMISNGKRLKQIVESFLTNLNTCNAS